jgi:hypothetical protein
MASWLCSLSGLLALSYLALLSLVVRSRIDARFIVAENLADLEERFIAVWIVGFTAAIWGLDLGAHRR